MQNTPSVRIPPQNVDAEKAVLGSIMVRADGMQEVETILLPQMFYTKKHADIYKVMLDLYSRSEPIDLLSVTSTLQEKNLLSKVGGRAYLTELVNAVPASTNIKYYATVVQRKHTLRSLIEAADFISELGFKEDAEDITDILDAAEKKIFNVVTSPTNQRFDSIKDILPDTWERIESLHENKGQLRGIPTGFRDLDTLLSGFQRADLVILAARPSMGKTTLALDIARKVAVEHTIPVGIFSLEMASQQLVDRMLAAESRVNAWNLRTGRLSRDEEFSQLRDALDKLAKAPIFIDDQAGNSIAQMKSTARRLKSEHGLGLIIVDYLQLMTTSRLYDSMVNQVTEISRSLKGLARELDVPVIAISQLSRAVESRGGKPRLSDLRDSGSIEQDADVVMFIHREDRYKEPEERTNIAEILVEKHRNGPVGKVDLYFDERKGTFLDLEKSSFEEFEAGSQNDDFEEF